VAITSFELVQIMSDYVTADLVVWKRYRQRAPGMVEIMIDANPHLATAHRRSPFIPAGVFVRVPIDQGLILGKPQSKPQDYLWTDKSEPGSTIGYSR
jgi:phage tail protein X